MVDIGDSPAGPLLVYIYISYYNKRYYVCMYVCMYVCLYVYQKLLNTTLSDLQILHTYSFYTKNANEGGILFLAILFLSEVPKTD